MNCEIYQEHISELIDNELSDDHDTNMYRHLAECPACRSFLQSALQLKEAVHTIPLSEPETKREEGRTRWIRKHVRIPLPAAALYVLLLLGGIVGTSFNFMHDAAPAVTDRQHIIYISEYPEIEIQLMTDEI